MTTFLPNWAVNVSCKNVKDFGAIGNGVHDDTANIQAAIDAAQAVVGGGTDGFGSIVYFPPGLYLVTSSLVFNTTRAAVQLIGSGRTCTEITGNIVGFTVEKPDDNTQNIERIENLAISNTRLNSDSGALHLAACVVNVNNCRILGAIGAKLEDNVFCSSFKDCEFVSSFPYPNASGTIGIACQQVGLYNCRFQLFEVGIMLSNSAPVAVGCATEVCGTGLMLGVSMPAAGQDLWSSGTTYAINDLVLYPNSVGAEYVSIQNSNTNHLPTDTSWWSPAPNSTHYSAVSGAAIIGFQTERCDTGIAVIQATGSRISGACITGSTGTWKRTASITWSAGTATLTTVDSIAGFPSTFQVYIDSATHSGYNTGTFVTATKTSSNTFTYDVVSNPGGSDGTSAQWSRQIQYGIRMRGAAFCTLSDTVISLNNVEVAKLDLDFSGSCSYQGTVLQGVNAAGSVTLPRGPAKAGIIPINCDFTIPMVYADLPGESTVTVNTPLEGMEYNITDGQKASGGTAALGDTVLGSSSGHYKIRYNGSNWTRCG